MIGSGSCEFTVLNLKKKCIPGGYYASVSEDQRTEPQRILMTRPGLYI